MFSQDAIVDFESGRGYRPNHGLVLAVLPNIERGGGRSCGVVAEIYLGFIFTRAFKLQVCFSCGTATSCAVGWIRGSDDSALTGTARQTASPFRDDGNQTFLSFSSLAQQEEL